MSLPFRNEPIPYWDALVDKAGMVTDLWTQWLDQSLLPQVQAAPTQIGQYSNGGTPLDDALGITVVANVPTTGLYLFVAALQIVVAAGVTSNVQLTLTWTSNGVTQTEAFTAIANGANTDHGSFPFSIIADGGTPVSISTTYASNPANAMQYNLAASVNLVGVIS